MKTPKEHQAIKHMKRSLGLNNERISDITGLSLSNVNRNTSPKGVSSPWLKLILWVFEKLYTENEQLRTELNELKARTTINDTLKDVT